VEADQTAGRQRVPWNKDKLVGQKAPFKPKDVWTMRARMEREHRTRDLALFNLGIDSKLRGCDLVALRVRDIQHGTQAGGFDRIRHHGQLANGSREASLALARELLRELAPVHIDAGDDEVATKPPTFVCAHCGDAMIVLQTFTRGQSIRAPPQERAR